MTVRFPFSLLLLFCLLAPCAAAAADAPPVFACKRKGFAIAYATPPTGWTGPVYAGGPALDSWTFSTGPLDKADALEIRVYDAKDSPLRWDTASDAAILADLKEGYNHPRVEKLPSVPVDGHPVRVRAIHSDGVEELLANMYFEDSLISVMFTTADPAELARRSWRCYVRYAS